MMFGGHLAFASPYLLGFLAALPVLWWLLRLTPPAPRKIAFPALMLLRDLASPEQTPARTPWWLLLLRAAIASLLILACAGPLINPQAAAPGKGALLIAVDNDWAAARAWDARQTALHDLIRAAERENRSVILLPTAPPEGGGDLQMIGPIAAKAAYNDAARIAPEPWPADWRQAGLLLQKLDRSTVADAVWLSSGLGGADAKNFAEILQNNGGARILGDAENPIYLLTPPQNEGDDVELAVRRAATDSAAQLAIAALGPDGETLAHLPVDFTAGAPRAAAPLDLPPDIRNQIARFEIEGPRSAATTALLDTRWQHRPVGLIGDKTELDQHSLLSGLFYIDRALKPYADIHVGRLDDLLRQNMAVLVLTDATGIDDDEIAPLTDWIRHGGVLVRFAGEHLAAAPNPKQSDLLPVPLRTGDRAMGGSLSWTTPQTLQAFPANSPFRGLAVPADVTVSRQILAEPSEDLAPHSWAALADGTPLVTAKNLGEGISVLFHVPANSNWSNLPLSGLFVEMLRRIVDLSRGVAGENDFTALPPYLALDAFGDMHKPGDAAQPIGEGDFAQVKAGPQHPPGLYGAAAFNRAFNLGAALGQPIALTGVATEGYKQNQTEIDLAPYLLTAALLLLFADLLISLRLRGILTRWRAA